MIPIAGITALLLRYGYVTLFFGTAFGGEILLLAVGVLSSLGYFNIYLAILISTVGITLEDSLWYAAGRSGRKKFTGRIGKFLMPKSRLDKVEKLFNKHGVKAIIFVRFVYGLRGVILITAGLTKMKFYKFYLYNFLGTLVWAAILTSLGFFFGESFELLQEYIHDTIILMTIVAFMVIIVLIIISIVKKRLAKKYKLNGQETEKLKD